MLQPKKIKLVILKTVGEKFVESIEDDNAMNDKDIARYVRKSVKIFTFRNDKNPANYKWVFYKVKENSSSYNIERNSKDTLISKDKVQKDI